MLLPGPIQNLMDAFSRLPGIGPKTASRLTFYMLRAPEDISLQLAQALADLKSGTAICRVCLTSPLLSGTNARSVRIPTAAPG